MESCRIRRERCSSYVRHADSIKIRLQQDLGRIVGNLPERRPQILPILRTDEETASTIEGRYRHASPVRSPTEACDHAQDRGRGATPELAETEGLVASSNSGISIRRRTGSGVTRRGREHGLREQTDKNRGPPV